MVKLEGTLSRIGLLALVSGLAGLLVAGLLLPVLGGLGLGARAAVRQFENLPTELQVPPLPQRSKILAADGSLLATFYFENRVDVQLDQVAPIMRKAIIGIEDSRFYAHSGIDFKGALRALATNAQAGGVKQGGSTLTQQYVKNVLIEKARVDSLGEKGVQAATKDTLGRKLREARYAMALEKKLTKDEILRRYLNIAYFGDGAYGIYAASKHYFSLAPWQLELKQAATLAGLVRNPNGFNPRLHPKAGKQRRDVVLQRMADLHFITQQEAQKAINSPLDLNIHPQDNGCEGSSAPFFCDYVLEDIKALPTLGATRADRIKLLLQGGLIIHTTLDPKVQQAADSAVRQYVPPSGPYGASEAVVEPGTGKIQALAVNRPYGSGKGQTRVNLATDTDHGGSQGFQSGSTFKAFTLAAALQHGLSTGFTMNAPNVLTNPGNFRTCSGAVLDYGGQDVHNASPNEGGNYTLRKATWQSVNTYFVKLEQKIGLCGPVQVAKALGVHKANGEPIPGYPSFTLGVYDVSPLTMANAYATFAAHGKYCEPMAITDIVDRSGQHLDLPKQQCRQALDPGLADTVSDVLQGVVTHGTGTAAAIGRPAAGKTGTVENFSAAWYCGYVPQLSSCVWFGFPEGAHGRELTRVTVNGTQYYHVYGASIPAPIWGATMRQALQGEPVKPFPPPDHAYLPQPKPTFSAGGGLAGGGGTPAPAPAPVQPPAPAPPPGGQKPGHGHGGGQH